MKKVIQKRWTEEEISYLKKNHDILSRKEIAENLGRTKNSVQIKANKLGLKKASPYYYNKQYFYKIDTPEKAYWLGFMAADGSINYRPHKRNYEVCIKLKSTDINHLRKFNKALEGNVEAKIAEPRIAYFDGQTPVETTCCQIRYFSKELAEGLMKNGVVTNKTYEGITIPELNKELMWMYILGFFDGDGFISFPKDNSPYGYRIGVCSADLKILEKFKGFMESQGLKVGSISTDTLKPMSTVKNYKLDIRDRESVQKFIDNTYKISSVSLDRKYQNYLKLNKWLSR